MNPQLLIFTVIFILISRVDTKLYQCDPTSACGCSISQTDVNARIIGGETVSDRSWKWIVSLQINNSHVCGASLINEKFAITAAHCLKNTRYVTSDYSILSQTNYLSQPPGSEGERRVLEEIFIHPNYDVSTSSNDIAIIRFSPLTRANLKFVCLPSSNLDPFYDDDEVVAAGWGVTSLFSNVASNSLLQVSLKIVPVDSTPCQRAPIHNRNTQFCAGIVSGGKDTCQGDSGGPLMAFVNNRWVLVGITSYGYGCALAGYAGVYTRTSHYIEYIQSIINSPIETIPPLQRTTTLGLATVSSSTDRLFNNRWMIVIFILCAIIKYSNEFN